MYAQCVTAASMLLDVACITVGMCVYLLSMYVYAARDIMMWDTFATWASMLK